jgi:hypothetical protein
LQPAHAHAERGQRGRQPHARIGCDRLGVRITGRLVLDEIGRGTLLLKILTNSLGS